MSEHLVRDKYSDMKTVLSFLAFLVRSIFGMFLEIHGLNMVHYLFVAVEVLMTHSRIRFDELSVKIDWEYFSRIVYERFIVL